MSKIKTMLGSALAVAWLRQVSSSNTLRSLAVNRSLNGSDTTWRSSGVTPLNGGASGIAFSGAIFVAVRGHSAMIPTINY